MSFLFRFDSGWIDFWLVGTEELYDEQETSQNYSICDEILNSFNGANRSIYFWRFNWTEGFWQVSDLSHYYWCAKTYFLMRKKGILLHFDGLLISYNKQEKEKLLLLRDFVNRLMIFMYKIIIVVSENRRKL